MWRALKSSQGREKIKVLDQTLGVSVCANCRQAIPNRSIEVKKPAFHLQPKNTQNFYKSQKPLKTFWLFRYLSYIKGKKGVWFTTEIWWISKFLKNQNTLKKGSYRGNVSEGNQWIEALSYWHGNHLNDTMGFGSWPRNCLLHVHVVKEGTKKSIEL